MLAFLHGTVGTVVGYIASWYGNGVAAILRKLYLPLHKNVCEDKFFS